MTEFVQRVVDKRGGGKKLYIPKNTDICEFLGINTEQESDSVTIEEEEVLLSSFFFFF